MTLQPGAIEPKQPQLKFPLMHSGRRAKMGMLLYPALTLLGPQAALTTFCNVHLIWKTRDFIESDSGIGLRPTGRCGDPS